MKVVTIRLKIGATLSLPRGKAKVTSGVVVCFFVVQLRVWDVAV